MEVCGIIIIHLKSKGGYKMDELKTNTCGCGHDHEHEHGEDCGCGEHATMMLQLDDGSELKCTWNF